MDLLSTYVKFRYIIASANPEKQEQEQDKSLNKGKYYKCHIIQNMFFFVPMTGKTEVHAANVLMPV